MVIQGKSRRSHASRQHGEVDFCTTPRTNLVGSQPPISRDLQAWCRPRTPAPLVASRPISVLAQAASAAPAKLELQRVKVPLELEVVGVPLNTYGGKDPLVAKVSCTG